MKKYVANRKDICGGELLRTNCLSFEVSDNNGNIVDTRELEKQGIINISFFGGLVCRGMLFNINEDGLANDLIYTTPTKYPIKDKYPKIDVESEFIIDHYVELEELLKYLKYGVDLTQGDLNKIYKTLIANNHWLKHNMKLFGWKKTSYGCHTNGGIETIPMEVYRDLSFISCSNNGKPHIEEPGYSLIKKRK